MQMGYEYAPKLVASDDHAIAVFNLNNHITLSNVKSSRTILAFGTDVANFLG